jgi:FAD synthase
MKLIILSIQVMCLILSAFNQMGQIKGRVVDAKMADQSYTEITNLKNQKSTFTDKEGFYIISASIGDTLSYRCIGYTTEKRIVAKLDRHIDVLVMDRSVNCLGSPWTKRQWNKAEKEMDKVYQKLEAKAKHSGKWDY